MVKRFWTIVAFLLFAAIVLRFANPVVGWAQIFETHNRLAPHELVSATEAKRQADEILAEAEAAAKSLYTVELYVQHLSRLEKLTKTVDQRSPYSTQRGESTLTGREYLFQLYNLARFDIPNIYRGQPNYDAAGSERLEPLAAADTQLREWRNTQPEYTVVHWNRLFSHLWWSYVTCTFLAGMFYLALIMRRQCRSTDQCYAGFNMTVFDNYGLPNAYKIVLDRPDHFLLAAIAFPIGLFVYPNYELLRGMQRIPRGLAYVMAALFSVFTGTASAQSPKKDDKRVNTGYALVVKQAEAPKKPNSISFGLEGVDKYHGPAVGEIFQADPGLRFMARYTRTTDRGDFYVDSWNSVGEGFNTEADIGFGYSRNGWDVSGTRLFVRGGDVMALTLSKSVQLKKIPLTASLQHFFGTTDTSPPGGTVFKLSTVFSHPVGLSKNLRLTHNFAASADTNPFGLGDGFTSMGFYTAKAGYKNLYAAWTATVPLIGSGNTSRGFRQSMAVGYRSSFAW